jgi:hypothetical protein
MCHQWFLLAFLGACLSLSVCAQLPADTLTLAFQPLVGSRPLVLETEEYRNQLGQPYTLEQVRWYVSNLALKSKGRTVWECPRRHILMDAAQASTLTIRWEKPQGLAFDSLVFDVGLDSATHISGALGGDLDPTLGMYWAWNSGYIHVKIEGKSPACRVPQQSFQFHLGGYRWPYATVCQVGLACQPSATTLSIAVDLGGFLDQMDFSQSSSVMSPGALARKLSDAFAQQFTLRP